MFAARNMDRNAGNDTVAQSLRLCCVHTLLHRFIRVQSKNMRRGGVTVTNNLIHIVVDTEVADPIQVRPDTVDNCCSAAYRRALEYLQGVCVLLQFFSADVGGDVPTTRITVHLDNLLAFNILTRYLPSWASQDWHTSRDKPIPARAFLQDLWRWMGHFGHLRFHNVSPSMAEKDECLRHICRLKE